MEQSVIWERDRAKDGATPSLHKLISIITDSFDRLSPLALSLCHLREERVDGGIQLFVNRSQMRDFLSNLFT
jgi:hypothetical protein